MKSKHLISLLLSVIITLLCFPMQIAYSADSEEEITIWNGTADTSWYDADEKEVHIHTAEQLAGIFAHPTEGMTFYLEKDINLNSNSSPKKNVWKNGNMDGVFYGQNHKIYGLYGKSLFNTIGENGIVQDLYITAVDTPQSILSLIIKGIAQHCIVDGNITLETKPYYKNRRWYLENVYLGGICNKIIDGKIKYCQNNAGISLTVDMLNASNFNPNLDTSPVNYSPAYSVGGICGSSDNGFISNCSNYGNFSLTVMINPPEIGRKAVTPLSYCSAIGTVYSGIIQNCYNYTAETPLTESYEYKYVTIRNCYNVGGTITKSVITPQNLTCMNCYYQSGIDKSGETPPANVKEKNKENMQKPDFATNLGLAFAYVENDYPKLAWELGIIYGDINSDGTADIADVVLLQKALLTETELDSKVAELADLDFNGIINAVDLTLLKRMIIDELL